MAINVSFNGATIYKPGAYSKVSIDLGGGFPLSPTGIVAIFGEAEAGAPGSNVTSIANNVFSPDQLPLIKSTYRNGPLVDACNFLFAPGADGAIPGGAQAVYIYKTNASVRSQLALGNSFGTLRALEWGTGGNKLTYKNVLVPATPAQTASSSVFDTTNVAIQGKTLVLRTQGADTSLDNTFTVPGTVVSRATLTTALAAGGNWSGGVPSGVSFTVGGLTDATATLSAARSTSGTPNREGYDRNFELVSGNLLAYTNISAGLFVAGAENQAIVTISNKRDLTSESSTIGGTVVLKIGRNGGNVSPKVTVNATQILLINNAVSEYALNLADFGTMAQLADFISSSTGGSWNAVVGNTLYGQLSPSAMDKVVNLGANASSLAANALPALIKKDANDTAAFFAQSANVAILNQVLLGLPDAATETYLAGGALGASQTADMANALAAFTKIHVNSVVPLFSRDASADIADALTDGASTYTILGIHQSVKTHCSLMATTKNRSERQGYLSLKDTYVNCKNESQTLADFRQQLVIQDVRQTDSNGAIKWFQPWAAACMLAGARGGSPIGLPMTGKYFNMSGIRQTAQPMSTPEQNIVLDFDPDSQYDDAIANNLTFWEHPKSGGFKLVVDNTTYGRDGNWVYNRANVLYAADVLTFDFRTQLENIYVGVKNTVKASEVKSTAESILNTYLAQGITVSTSDAKNGFKQLVVQINGNTINISVVVKLVEGIDFILADITLQRAQQSA